MSAPTSPTLRDALAEYRRTNGLRPDEAASPSWICRLGPLGVRLPNFAWRRKAIEAHDLHHLLTGYPLTMRGEFQMAAWEFGAGDMPHWAATLFCLPLVVAGLLWIPRGTFAAFMAGRGSHSFHGAEMSENVLDAPLRLFHTELLVTGEIRTPWSDLARFVILVLRASLLLVLPVALLLGVWMVLIG